MKIPLELAKEIIDENIKKFFALSLVNLQDCLKKVEVHLERTQKLNSEKNNHLLQQFYDVTEFL